MNRLLLGSTAVAALGGLLLGFDTAVIAGATSTLEVTFHLTPMLLGITVSCAIWGTVFGGLLAGVSGERYGSRESLRTTAVLYLISALGCAFAGSLGVFLGFRVLSGFAIGGCSVFSPMYISETAPPKLRGRLVACFQLCIVSGILLAYGSNAGLFLFVNTAMLWRWELGVAALPAAMFLVLLGTIPQSPRWLAKRGRHTEAYAILRSFGIPEPEHSLEQIQSKLAQGLESSRSLFAPEFRRPLLVALALGLFNQLSGINAILYYANYIFAAGGFASLSGAWQAVAVGTANLLFTFVGMLLIDRVGRKPLLLAGSTGMAVTLSGVACIFLYGNFQRWLLPLLLAFIGFFAISQGAVVWVYLSEIFPASIREKGQSLASSWLWLLTAVVSGTFPVFAARSRGVPFVIFAAAMVVQFFVVLRFFPETKGASLEAMQASLEQVAQS